MMYKRYDKIGYEIKGWKYFSNQFWRALSIPVARSLAKTRVMPEQIVGLSFICGVLAAIVFSSPCDNAGRYGAVLFALFWLFDFVDGDLARITFRTSKRGEWLDSLCGKLITVIIYIGICIHCARSDDAAAVWIMGYALLSAFYVFGMIEKKTLQIRQGVQMQGKKASSVVDHIKKSFLKSIFHEVTNGHNMLYVLLIVGGLLNKLYLVLGFSVFYAWMIVFLTIYNSYREVRALDLPAVQ